MPLESPIPMFPSVALKNPALEQLPPIFLRSTADLSSSHLLSSIFSNRRFQSLLKKHPLPIFGLSFATFDPSEFSTPNFTTPSKPPQASILQTETIFTLALGCGD